MPTRTVANFRQISTTALLNRLAGELELMSWWREDGVGSRTWRPGLFQSRLDPSLNGRGPTGVRGTGDGELDGDCSYAFNATVFYFGASVLSSFSDGTSNTIAIGQHDAQCRSTGFAWNQANPGCGVFNPSTGKVTGVPSWKVPPVTSHATTFADAEMGDALLYGTSVAGPLPAATFQVAPTLADCDYRLLQAYTPRGLMVGIADGSVRVVSPTITPRTFWAAVTPAGGEVLGSDW